MTAFFKERVFEVKGVEENYRFRFVLFTKHIFRKEELRINLQILLFSVGTNGLT